MASTYSLLLIALCSLIYFNDVVKANCGGLIEEAYGTITSPLYPDNYPGGQDCLWEIKMPPNKNIWFHFKHFRLEDHIECAYDYVTIKTKMKDGSIREHGKFCGSQINNFNISDSNIVFIEFKSDGNSNYEGFQMDFYSDECGGLIEGGRGNISSPFFPHSYTPNVMCEWNLLVPPQHKIKLNFLQLEIEGGDGCPSDYLHIQSNSTEGKILDYGKFCGHLEPFLISSRDRFILKFVSDRSLEKKGFLVEYFIDQLTESESSVFLERPTTPVNETKTSFENQHTTQFVMSRNKENTFTDNYESTISSTLSTATSTYAPNQPKTDQQQKETENAITSISNILSALTLLTKKVSEIEERQITLYNQYENLFNKVLSSEKAFLEDKKYPFN